MRWNPQGTTALSKDVHNVKQSTFYLSPALVSVTLEFVVISSLPVIVQTDRSHQLEPQNIYILIQVTTDFYQLIMLIASQVEEVSEERGTLRLDYFKLIKIVLHLCLLERGHLLGFPSDYT